MDRPFVHLHVHSDFSLLDGACRVDDLVGEAARLHMPAIALTDHGNLFGAVEFFQKAKAAGVKPILGMEAYVAPGDRRDKTDVGGIGEASFHLTLLAATNEGYRNLLKLSTLAYREGFYYRPRVDKQLLKDHARGLIALSGCLNGEFASHGVRGDVEKATAVAAEYRDIFGPENYFLEVQHHGIPDELKLWDVARKAAKDLRLGIVPTNDSHYLHREDFEAHDVLLAVSTGKLVTDRDRLRLEFPEFYVKSPGEMRARFREFEEGCDLTLAIADRCEVTLPFGESHLPRFETPDGTAAEAYLRRIAGEGVRRRYSDLTPEIQTRLDYELGVIERMGFAGYFLIVWDIVERARTLGVSVGGGRGSAAGSLVSYALGVTNVDPLRYGLIFERFLNPQRKEMPDIDIDLSHDGRGKVVDYCRTRYGNDNVTQIITFASLKARAVIKDVGRALGIERSLVEKIATKVPEGPEATLEEGLETAPEIEAMAAEDGRLRKLLEIGKRLEGLHRHASRHAAGVVISDKPLVEYVPLYVQDGEESTQFDMNSVAKLGLLKIDLLGLQMLTVIDRTVARIRERHGVSLKADEIPLDDPKTYALLERGDVRGVFQLDSSSGIRELMQRMKPDSINDIIAVVALNRPGPMKTGMVEKYVRGRHGIEKPEYAHPDLEPILSETYGTVIYQEQVMRIANRLAGFDMAEADDLRKAMGKKKQEIMLAGRDKFIAGAIRKGIGQDLATRIGDQLVAYSEYCFNKSHATAYGLLCYQTAYLKAHYPVEYMAALMTVFLDKSDKVLTYIEECRRMGIELRPPDVNVSIADFSVEDGAIRCGLGAIKNLGEKAAESILAGRAKDGAYSSLIDFVRRADLKALDRRNLESLVKCGAFDSFGSPRAAMLEGLSEVLAYVGARRTDAKTGQLSFFSGAASAASVEPRLPPVEEWPVEERLAYEKETLGYYLTANPLRKYEGVLEGLASTTLDRVTELAHGTEVLVGGIVSNIRVRTLKQGERKGEKYLSFTVTDLMGRCEALLFGREYQSESSKVAEDQVVFLAGAILSPQDKPAVRVNEVIPVDEAPAKLAGSLVVRLPGNREIAWDGLKDLLAAHRGPLPVVLETVAEGKSWRAALPEPWQVAPSDLLRVELDDLLGEGSVRYVARPGAGRRGGTRTYARAGGERRWKSGK